MNSTVVCNDEAAAEEGAGRGFGAVPAERSPSSSRVAEFKSLLAIAISAGGVQAMGAVVNICTIKFVAPLGENALAAVTSGVRLFLLVQALLLGLNVGSMALIARAWGAGNLAEAADLSRLSVMVSVLIMMPVAAVIWSAAPELLLLLGLDPGALPEGVSYIRTLTLFFVSIGIYLVLAGAMRACGDAWVPLLSGVVIHLITVVAAYGLIGGRWGLPPQGVAGASMAAGIGNIAGLLLILALLGRRFTAFLRGRWSFRGAVRLRDLSVPAALEQVIRHGSVLAFLWVVASYGSAPYAAYGVGIMLMAPSLVCGFGFSVATAVKVGQAMGNGNPELRGRVLRSSLMVAVTIMTSISVLMEIFADDVALWLVGSGEVQRYTTTFIHLFALGQPLLAVDFVLTGALQGIGDTRWPMYSVFVGPLLMRFGSAIGLMWLGMPVEWVYATMLIDYLAKVLVLVYRTFTGPWSHLTGT